MQACLVCSTKAADAAVAADVAKKPPAVLPLTAANQPAVLQLVVATTRAAVLPLVAVSQPAVLQLVVATTRAVVLPLAAVTMAVAKAVADARNAVSSFLS
jgi:hypothetical protein